MLASGFTAASVSRILFFGIIVSSILVSITDSKYLFYINVAPHLWRYRQFWRLLTWQTCYTNSTELLFAAMSIYHMRVIERLWGSRKFVSFLLSTLAPTLLIPPLILALILRPLTFNRLNTLPAGPTPLIFALLAQYHAAIPHVYKYRIFTSSQTHPTTPSSANSQPPSSITLSDKSLTYLLALQLALSSLPGSLVAATVGWMVGVAWRNDLGPARWARWRAPGWIVGEGKKEGEDFEGLRRRMEGESGRGTGAGGIEEREGVRRRGIGRGILDQFRGRF